VVECALEHGLPHQKAQIVHVLRQDLMKCSRNRNAVHVVEKALEWGNPADRQALVEDFLRQPAEQIAQLSRNQFGSIVVRALQRNSKQVAGQIQNLVKSSLQPPRSRGAGRHTREVRA